MSSKTKRAKLTKGYVDKVRPSSKDEFHWDTDVKGFGLRVTPTGKTTFIVQGRVEGSGNRPSQRKPSDVNPTDPARAGSNLQLVT